VLLFLSSRKGVSLSSFWLSESLVGPSFGQTVWLQERGSNRAAEERDGGGRARRRGARDERSSNPHCWLLLCFRAFFPLFEPRVMLPRGKLAIYPQPCCALLVSTITLVREKPPTKRPMRRISLRIAQSTYRRDGCTLRSRLERPVAVGEKGHFGSKQKRKSGQDVHLLFDNETPPSLLLSSTSYYDSLKLNLALVVVVALKPSIQYFLHSKQASNKNNGSRTVD